MVSEEFKLAFVTGGGNFQTCGFCGMVYIASKHLKEVQDQAAREKKPLKKHKVIEGDAVHYGKIGGVVAVAECNCDDLRQFENWILENRKLILTYIVRINEREILLGQTQLSDTQALLKEHIARENKEKES